MGRVVGSGLNSWAWHLHGLGTKGLSKVAEDSSIYTCIYLYPVENMDNECKLRRMGSISLFHSLAF